MEESDPGPKEEGHQKRAHKGVHVVQRQKDQHVVLRPEYLEVPHGGGVRQKIAVAEHYPFWGSGGS